MIFCVIRKKFIVLTPEEWVRQHTVLYLHETLGYPISLINVEKLIRLNGLSKRYDVVVYDRNGSVFLMVECKATHVPITQIVFDQIARYNLQMKAQFLMVTNGISHYFCRLDYQAERYHFLTELPEFPTL